MFPTERIAVFWRDTAVETECLLVARLGNARCERQRRSGLPRARKDAGRCFRFLTGEVPLTCNCLAAMREAIDSGLTLDAYQASIGRLSAVVLPGSGR